MGLPDYGRAVSWPDTPLRAPPGIKNIMLACAGFGEAAGRAAVRGLAVRSGLRYLPCRGEWPQQGILGYQQRSVAVTFPVLT